MVHGNYGGQGRVPVGVDTSDTDFNTVEKAGGEKTVALKENNVPSHFHNLISKAVNGYFYCNRELLSEKPSTGNPIYAYNVNNNKSGWFSEDEDLSFRRYITDRTGGGVAHNNVQPYITCYMWKRIK